MSSEYDIRIKALFDEARVDASDEAFVRQVMASMRRQERRVRLRWLAGLLAVIAVLWLVSPDLSGLVASASGFAVFVSDRAVTLLTDMSTSPVTWIFLVPSSAHYLYRQRRRFV